MLKAIVSSAEAGVGVGDGLAEGSGPRVGGRGDRVGGRGGDPRGKQERDAGESQGGAGVFMSSSYAYGSPKVLTRNAAIWPRVTLFKGSSCRLRTRP